MHVFRTPDGKLRVVHAIFSSTLETLPEPFEGIVIDLTYPAGIDAALTEQDLFPESEVSELHVGGSS